MNKTLIKYLLKRTYPIILIVFAILLIVYPLPMLFVKLNDTGINLYTNVGSEGYENVYYNSYASTHLYNSTIFLMILAYILPIFIRSMILSKPKCDLYLALPIKKGKLFITTSVFAYLAMIVAWTVMMLIGMSFTAIVHLPVRFGYYFLYILTMYLVSLAAFATSTLMSSLANNKFDAWLLAIIGIVLPLLIGLSLQVTENKYSEVYYCALSPIFAANNVTTFFEKSAIIYPDKVYSYFTTRNPGMLPTTGIPFLVSYISPIVLSVLFLGLSYLQTIKFKAEDAGELTRYRYSFKMIIPILFFVVLYDSDLNSFFTQSGTLSLISILSYTTIFYFILFFISKRKIKFDKWMVIFYFVSLIAALGLRSF